MRPPMVVAASLTITDLAAVTIELHPTKRIESYDESYNTFNKFVHFIVKRTNVIQFNDTVLYKMVTF